MSQKSKDVFFPYELDHLRYLLEKEHRRHQQFDFKARSPQLSYRKNLIKSLKCLASKLHLTAATVHLAVHLLDFFMDCHDILPSQLMLAASTCLLVSAKYVDVDQNIPKITHLQSLTNYHNSLHEYQLMEKMLLNFWKWDLNFVSIIQFLECLLSCDHLFASCDGRVEPSSPNNPNDFKLLATQLANTCLSEIQFIYFKPSMVAASCIATTRIQFQLFPIWPPRLEQLSGYSYSEIDPCVQCVIYHTHINTQQPERFTLPPQRITANIFACEDQKTDWKKCKLKAPPANYNCARARRHLIQSRDLKKMYCAM